MAFFRGDFYSDSLGMQTGVQVIIPETGNENQEFKVLYLLHGLSDNCSNWVRNTSISRYATEYHTAVIIPEVQRSYYMDMKNGPSYFTYVSKELPAFAQKMFGLSGEREKNIVAGLSMGGYGALKCALTYPEQYAYCAAFSSACDIRLRTSRTSVDERMLRDIHGIFGENPEIPQEADLYYLSQRNASLSEKPKMYMSCGLKDILLPENQAMQKQLKECRFDVNYEEWEGDHTWDFWDTSILKAFRYFFGDKQDGVKTPLSDGK